MGCVPQPHRALSHRLRRLGCSHVHAHFGTNPAAVACIAHRLCGLSYSVTFHGPHEFDPQLRLNLRDKIEGTSFVAAVSAFGHRELSKRFPEFAGKFRFVPCGLDASWFDAPFGQGHDSHKLLCVARLDPQKNPLLLLEAVRILVERGVEFRLTIAGDGSLRRHVEARISADGLGRHVALAGWQTQQQVLNHLQAARALVLSSHDEGLPVVIMEAFALGVPVIAPDVGGVRELVETGASGWLVPPADARALADAMHACLNASTEVLRGLGVEARRRLQRYDIRLSVSVLTAEFCVAGAGSIQA